MGSVVSQMRIQTYRFDPTTGDVRAIAEYVRFLQTSTDANMAKHTKQRKPYA